MSNAFDEILFDPAIEYGAKGGPMFSTTVVMTDSGAEQRVAKWSSPRRRWTVGQGVKSAAQMRGLIAFFLARQGRLRGFRFLDRTDCQAAGDALDNSAATATLQLRRVYSDTLTTSTRAITKPVAGTVTLAKDGAALAPAHWTLDTTTGLVTLDQAYPGSAFTWAGQYHVPVRFDTDHMEVARNNFDALAWQGVDIVELLV